MLFSSRNELLLLQTWTLGWAPGPMWTPRKRFSSRNERFFFFFLYRPVPLAGLLALFGLKRCCSQAEMSGFFFFSADLHPWLGSWSCVDPKEAVLKQK